MNAIVRERRGLATIEVTICLIPLMLMLLAMFAVFRYLYEGSGMAVVARHAAWMGRHQPWAPSDKRELLSLGMVASDDYDRILGPSPILDPNVVLKSEVRKQTSIFTFDWEIDFEHYVWGGTWDHQEIPFERHRRLTPSRKFTIFTDVDVNWSRFGSLAGLANSALASAAEQARENYQSANRRDGEADRALRRRVEAEIHRKESERALVLDQIRRLEQDEAADPNVLDEMRRRLRSVENQLVRLREARANLGSANATRPH